MKNKKILYSIIFSSIFVFFFSLTIFLLANMHWFYPYQTVIEYEYDSKKDDRIDELKEECEKLLLEQNDYEKFYADYEELYSLYYDLYTYYKIEYINVCNKPLKGNSYYLNIYNNKKNDLLNWFGNLYTKINDSAYKNQFFEGKTEKEINYLIKSYSEEARNQFDVINQISDEYDGLNDTEKTAKFNSYYAKFINAKNQYAKIVGYENYYDYSNEKEYSRDYSKEDVIKFVNYIYTYFIKDFNKREGIYYNTRSFYEKYYVTSSITPYFMSDLALNFNTYNHSKYQDLIDLYAESMGSDYYDTYSDFKNNGILVESNEEDNYDGGFTTYLPALEKPVMYLGNTSYQTPFVYIHEFGHYYNFTKAGRKEISLDLCETHSQANELLFLDYILSKTTKFSNREINHIIAQKLEYFTKMAIYTSLIGIIELEAYNKGVVDEETISTIISETARVFFPNIFEIFRESAVKSYIESILIDHPMYYFSYSTSIISSLNLFFISLNSYDNAKEKYLYIQSYDNYDGFVNTLVNAGLKNPFEEEIFIDLSQLFDRIK